MQDDPAARKCFNTGYGNEPPVENFIATFSRHGIEIVVDSRTPPCNRFRPDFNRENLSK